MEALAKRAQGTIAANGKLVDKLIAPLSQAIVEESNTG
jgi:hypothetical protein